MAEPRLGADAACWQGEGGGKGHSWQSMTLKESAGAGGEPQGGWRGDRSPVPGRLPHLALLCVSCELWVETGLQPTPWLPVRELRRLSRVVPASLPLFSPQGVPCRHRAQ